MNNGRKTGAEAITLSQRLGGSVLPAGARGLLARYPHWDIYAGVTVFLGILGFAFLGPLLYQGSPLAVDPLHLLEAPSARFPLGTDALGRDQLARLMHGARTSISVGIPASLLTLVVGVAFGMTAAMAGGLVDRAMMRLLDALLAVPNLVVLIFFAAVVPLSTPSLILLLGLTSWPGLARIVRNETLAYREKDFVLAARQFGAGGFYLARVHVLRAMLPILVVYATFMLADSILALAGLSFLGLGVQPPYPSLGGLLQDGLELIYINPWWLYVPPGLIVFAALVSINLVGQGLLERLEGRR